MDGLGPVAVNKTPSMEELKRHLEQHKVPKKVMSEDEDGSIANTVLLHYHYWASIDLTPNAILMSYLVL